MSAWCRVPWCATAPRLSSHALCARHTQRWRNHRDYRRGKPSVWDRIDSHTDKNGPIPLHRPDLGPCWIWNGPLARGYGRITVQNREWFAHRLIYLMRYRRPITGLSLDHLCFEKRCVNPDHLDPVPNRENTRRHFARATHCGRGHELTAENTYHPPGTNKRTCRTCSRDHKRRRNDSRIDRPWLREWSKLRRKYAPTVFARDGYACLACGSTEFLSLDHIVPLSRGGRTELMNLQTLCRPCNSAKHTQVVSFLPKTGSEA